MFARSHRPQALLAALLLGGLIPGRVLAAAATDPAAALARAVAAAETNLKRGELEAAESHYRSALLEGWLLLGDLDTVEGRLSEAREALRRAGRPVVPPPDPSLAALTLSQRSQLEHRVKAELSGVYQNLGVMQAQARRFERAAELFEQASALDPDSRQVQYSLGVARFNARQFEKATGPLSRALAADPADGGVRRMLAMAWLDLEKYDAVVELLRDDPGREADASLQFSYGLALVRSGRAAEAQPVFTRLLARHGDSAQVRVLLGQASAQQGDFPAAIAELTRALQLRPDVAEAHASLGRIYLRQGRLAEAEEALRAELVTRPDDAQSQNALATVLDQLGRQQEAVPLLRRLLESKPGFANARYLLGKILLAQGSATQALAQLEAAVRVAPEDANIHYQLGRAYQAVGRTGDAEREFEQFRQIKEKNREVKP